MVSRNSHDSGFIKQVLIEKPRISDFGWANNRDIKPARHQPWQQTERLLFQQFDVDVRVGFPKMRQKLRHQTSRRAVDCTNAQDGCLIPPIFAKRRLKPIRLFDDVPSGLEKLPTRLRQSNTPRGAHKKSGAQILFQNLDLPTKRCRQHVEVLCCPAKM